jgi:hypothetical protein
LSLRGERPRDDRAAEKCNEFASFHRIVDLMTAAGAAALGAQEE